MKISVSPVLILFLLVFASVPSQAQQRALQQPAASRPKPDTLSASGGDITIGPIAHATLQIVYGPKVILVDPTTYSGYDGVPQPLLLDYNGLKAPTLILVTDDHSDHLDQKAIAAMKTPTTKIVVPVAPPHVGPEVEGAIKMSNGETKTIDDMSIEAVPMYNLVRGVQGNPFHPKGKGNGYVVTVGGKRLYVAGDTECTPEMKALRNIDVAFLPMNLPYTMTPAEAAACALVFKPKIVYPYHYRGQDVMAFASSLKGSGIDVRLRDWYMGAPSFKFDESTLPPGVRVR
jgi:L-ascorbate metabolism protein UlaG (beta-lactamase superfamily)